MNDFYGLQERVMLGPGETVETFPTTTGKPILEALTIRFPSEVHDSYSFVSLQKESFVMIMSPCGRKMTK